MSRLDRKLEWVLMRMLRGTSRLAKAVVEFVMICALKFYVFLPFVWIGRNALLARYLFLWLIPVVLRLTKPIVFTINLILAWLTLVLDECVLVIRAIEAAINVLVKLFDHGHGVFNTIPNYPKVFQITDTQFRNTLKALPATCVKFESAPEILIFFTKYVFHDLVCPIVRYTYPLNWVYTLSSDTFKTWAYYGNAAPFPNTPGENCDSNNEVTSADFICAGLGVGYIILELALPILLLAIFLFVASNAIYDLFSATFYSVWLSIQIGIDTVILFVDTIAY